MVHRGNDQELAYLRLQAEWTRPMRIHLYRRIALSTRRRVLDIGCADGYITAQIAARTKGEVVGIDINPERIAVAKQNHAGVGFQTADAHDLPFNDAAFDTVITNFTLMWTKHPDRVLAQAKRVLAPGGALLVSGEPDYGGRIDEPPSLSKLADAWAGSITADGGDPFFGRKVRALFMGVGLRSVEIGVIPSIWEGANGEELHTYLNSLAYFLARRAGAALDIDEIISREKKAARSGERLIFLPIFWGLGEKG